MTRAQEKPNSTLRLRPTTAEELDTIHTLNAASWAGGLTLAQYHERERVLSSQPLTRNGGLRSYVLVDLAQQAPQALLSSCESIRKAAFIADAGSSEVREVPAHGIGSVFTLPKQRGNGYASVMLRQLGETLEREDPDGFSVLYSDIGKEFYAKLGWQPHRSSHLEVAALLEDDDDDDDDADDNALSGAGGVRYLTAPEIAALCDRDTAALKTALSQPSQKTRIAFVPDYRTYEWHWAREDFIAPHLRPHMDARPEVKGAITADGKMWMVWKRDFNKVTCQLDILRLVNLSTPSETQSETESEKKIAALFKAAAKEAAKWELAKVCLWNPDEITVAAAQRFAGTRRRIVVTDRETDSICSVKLPGHGSCAATVDWVANEKYAWC